MMVEIFLNFERWLVSIFGYRFIIYFEDSIVLIAGIFIGMLIMAILSGRVVFKLTKVNNLGANRLKLIRFKHEGVKQYIADPHNISESVETLLLVIFRPLFQIKEYNYRDERRTKIFLIVTCIVGVIVFTLAIICIFTVVDHIK